MKFNKLVGFSVVVGVLLSYCISEALAGDLGERYQYQQAREQQRYRNQQIRDQQRYQQQQQRDLERQQYQQQRDQQRYQYQQYRNQSRYNQYGYGYSGGGYGGFRPRYQDYGYGYYGGHSCHGSHGSSFGIHFGF